MIMLEWRKNMLNYTVSNEMNAFIEQFDEEDKKSILECIRKIRFVTTEELTSFYANEIISRYSKGPKTALFTVTEENPSSKQNHSNDDASLSDIEEKRKTYSSSDHVGYILENIVRTNSRYLTINPKVKQLKSERISRIVLVDDGINSGHRIIDFIKNDIFKFIRSSYSYKLCSIEVISFFAYKTGIDYIQSKTKIISNFVNKVYINGKTCFNNPKYTFLFEKYSEKITKQKIPLGFANTNGNIIFEHGIPNSLPPIFWDYGKRKSWIPLFPNRGISQELVYYFKNHTINQIESIADSGNLNLALSLFEEIENKRISRENTNLITVLFFLNKGILEKNLTNYVTFDNDEIATILKNLKNWGLVDDKNKVTEFGKDTLKTYSNISKKTQKVYNNFVDYLPTKFGDSFIHI